MTGPLGFLLVAVGIVLVALREPTWPVDNHWLGVALIVLGGIAIVYHVYRDSVSDYLSQRNNKND